MNPWNRTSYPRSRRHLLGTIPAGLALILIFLVPGCGSDDDPSAPKVDPPVEEPTGYIGPSLTLTEPARSAMIMSGTADDSPVQVNGTACDEVHDLASINVGGIDVPPPSSGECRNFGFQQSSRQGMTIVKGTATNSQGQVGGLAQSFLRSPEFFPPAEARTTGGSAASGLYMGIGQEFLDDGDRADMDDLVTILNHALNEIDFDALIGFFKFAKPDANGDGEIDRTSINCGLWTEHNTKTGFRVSKNGPFTHGLVEVRRLEFVGNTLVVEVGITDASIALYVLGNYDAGCAGDADEDAHGTVSLPGVTTLTTTVSFGVKPDGTPDVSVGDTEVVIPALSLNISIGWLADWLGLDTLAEDIASGMAVKYQDDIMGAAADGVEGILNDLLPGLIAELVVNESITLPSPFDTTVNVQSGFDLMTVDASGMRIGAYTQVMPVTPLAEHRGSAYGAIKYGGGVPSMDLDPNSFQVGVKDDLVNQFMWAIWMGGGLDIDDISAFVDPSALQGMDVQIFSTLPPVIMPGEAEGEIEVGWGDVRISATIAEETADRMIADAGKAGELVYARTEPLMVEFYLSAIVGGVIQTDSETNRLDASMDTAPEVFLQVTSVNDPEQVDPEIISIVNTDVGLVLQDMLPELLENLLGSFPLPSINVGDISGILPDIELGLSAAEIHRDGHYSVLAGDMATR